MKEITYICVTCGNVIFFPEDNKPRKRIKCDKCGEGGFLPANTRKMPYVTKEQYEEMIENDTWDDYLIRYLSVLPCVRDLAEQKAPQNKEMPEFTPRCPTCGCTNVRRISTTERAVNAGLFGLLGNKRMYQFECMNPNCKYKW